MKKILLFLRFPFYPSLLHFKLGFSSICHRCIVLFLLAIVIFAYLGLAPFHLYSSSLNDKSVSKMDKRKKLSVDKARNEWIKPRMDCQRVFNGDKALVQRMAKRRRKMKDPNDLEMNCQVILERNRDPGEDGETNITEMERQMPMAFARVVYIDYLFLEAELLANYAHNNWYCYVLDSKSSRTFQQRMQHLASCFDNVIVLEEMFDIDRRGSNMNKAMMECVRTLTDGGKDWKYLITLQNHDVQAKTNAEMAQIFSWLGGANDLEVELQLPLTKERLEHYRTQFDWTFDSLHLFKEEAMNHRTDKNGRPLALSLSKGYMTASLARQFVDFVVNELNLTTMLEQLNSGIFGVDEHFWQSLSSSEALDAPGGFPHTCFAKEIDEEDTSTRKYRYITRFAMWAPSSKCLSGKWRHAVCVFGLEDLMGPDSEIRRLPHLFVNKLMQQFDFDAILCWHRWMRERRRSATIELDEGFYRDWPQTKYQTERQLRKAGEHRGQAEEAIQFPKVTPLRRFGSNTAPNKLLDGLCPLRIGMPGAVVKEVGGRMTTSNKHG
uniref:Uncharacterized protein n=1 Tax=Globodera pallida TaxID=36090 RepID=A0A183BTH8_GLOPA